MAGLPLSADAESAIQQGIAAAKQPDYPRAIRFFETARAAAPHSPLPLYYLGLAESKIAGRELRAICWFRAFLAESPDSPKADAISAEIANLEWRSREVLLDLIKTVTTAADLLPPPAANEPQDPEGTHWDYVMKSVALLWARTGNADVAIQRAGRVSHPFLRTLTAIDIAGPLAIAGELERSKRVIATAVSSAEMLPRSDDQANALARAAAALANLGDGPGALIIAARIDDAGLRCQALAAIARAQATAGDFVAATATAEAIPVRYYRSAAQASIARTAAESGDRATATRMLEASRASLAGVVYDQNSVHNIGMRPAVLKPGRGYNLEALKRGVMLQEYAPRDPVSPPQTVNDANRQSFDISGLTFDVFMAEGLAGKLDMNAARSYVRGFNAQALSQLGIARARIGDIAGAKAMVDLSHYPEFQPYLDKRWMANVRVGIARGHALSGDEGNARTQLAAARIWAVPEDIRMIAEASNGWTAANEYLLNDPIFTALPEHLKGLPNTFPEQTFSALADTARMMADAQAIVFALRGRSLHP
jgi:tetratricopeptide (TPR) repeat protein